MNENKPLVEVQGLKMHFSVAGKGFGKKSKQTLKAVDDVTLSIPAGATFGLVGESGCGKTTVGRTILKLYKPTGGKIFFDGQDITDLSEKEFSPYRKDMQMIFQDPYASLDPRQTDFGAGRIHSSTGCQYIRGLSGRNGVDLFVHLP